MSTLWGVKFFQRGSIFSYEFVHYVVKALIVRSIIELNESLSAFLWTLIILAHIRTLYDEKSERTTTVAATRKPAVDP